MFVEDRRPPRRGPRIAIAATFMLMVLAFAAAIVYARGGFGDHHSAQPVARPVATKLPAGSSPRSSGANQSDRGQGRGRGAQVTGTRQHKRSASWPLPGKILIADKWNNRLILVGPHRHILWRFPRPGDLTPDQQFLLPDDAFYTPDRRHIIATEEDYHVIREIDVQTHRIIWEYGHPGVPGSDPGYLNGPDDAYRLPNGLTTVADIRNCRVLFIRRDKSIARQYGSIGDCRHDPPFAFDQPNGDTPLADGGMLVSEIGGGWVDRLDAQGHLVWAFQSSVQYPSDPQLLPNGHILVCDYNSPGRVVEVGRDGHVFATFGADDGDTALDHPSLAIGLPNGLVALNDDRNNRVIIVDMRRDRIVWQYGITGYYGDSWNYLNTPDGIDFLPS